MDSGYVQVLGGLPFKHFRWSCGSDVWGAARALTGNAPACSEPRLLRYSECALITSAVPR